jgi:hypothetical protein|uniref:Uncharacterized protein n=1 Tax=candidate division WOR-3 bacterium TaxID=2052148 RepID=A0A7C6EDD5_UNCW3
MRILILLLVSVLPLFAQLYLIDQPTPLSLMHGEYYIDGRFQNEGGMIFHFGIGLFDRFTLGASYGGNGFLGASRPTFFPRVGFQAKAVITSEGETFLPDLALGYDDQGFGDYDTIDKQYQVRSKGFYLSIGKTLEMSNTYFVFGPNYWFGANKRKGLSGFLAIRQTLSDHWDLILEYNLNIGRTQQENKRGFLNLGVAFNFNENLTFTFMLKDLLENRRTVNGKDAGMNRALNVSFHELF